MLNKEKSIIAFQVFRLGCEEIPERLCQGKYQGRIASI